MDSCQAPLGQLLEHARLRRAVEAGGAVLRRAHARELLRSGPPRVERRHPLLVQHSSRQGVQASRVERANDHRVQVSRHALLLKRRVHGRRTHLLAIPSRRARGDASGGHCVPGGGRGGGVGGGCAGRGEVRCVADNLQATATGARVHPRWRGRRGGECPRERGRGVRRGLQVRTLLAFELFVPQAQGPSGHLSRGQDAPRPISHTNLHRQAGDRHGHGEGAELRRQGHVDVHAVRGDVVDAKGMADGRSQVQREGEALAAAAPRLTPPPRVLLSLGLLGRARRAVEVDAHREGEGARQGQAEEGGDGDGGVHEDDERAVRPYWVRFPRGCVVGGLAERVRNGSTQPTAVHHFRHGGHVPQGRPVVQGLRREAHAQERVCWRLCVCHINHDRRHLHTHT
mmetsp:Transcript_642/g.1872  ORF Transcript_642/g.1872 Transcript_642/m.1872 type:complete len:399 (+) Transcript_642:1318-2514(+)